MKGNQWSDDYTEIFAVFKELNYEVFELVALLFTLLDNLLNVVETEDEFLFITMLNYTGLLFTILLSVLVIEKTLHVVLHLDFGAVIVQDLLLCLFRFVNESEQLAYDQLVEIWSRFDLLALDEQDASQEHLPLCSVLKHAQTKTRLTHASVSFQSNQSWSLSTMFLLLK